MSSNKEIDEVELGLFVHEDDGATLFLKPHEHDTPTPGYKWEILHVLGDKNKRYYNKNTGRYYQWVYGSCGITLEIWLKNKFDKLKTKCRKEFIEEFKNLNPYIALRDTSGKVI